MDSRGLTNIIGISPEQAALLEDLMEQEGLPPGEEQTAIPRRGRKKAALSHAQQRLWFLDQLEPGSPLYHLPLALRLQGPLSLPALQKSLNALVARHEALRTVFPVEAGKPIQEILDPHAVPLPLAEVRHTPGLADSAQADRRLAEESRRPFDLARGPLFRACLQRRSQEEHVLLLVMPHLLSDAWSLDLLYAELTAHYEAFARGKAPGLPEPSIQFADFAEWQRQTLQGGSLEQQLSYWRAQLAGAPTGLNVTTDHPRPAAATFHGAVQTLPLPRALSDALRQLSRSEGVTLFMTLLGAYQALLHRYTGQDDFLIGSAFSNRSRVETEGVVGFFVNTLPLRAQLAGPPTFRQLLGRVRESVLGAGGHQDLPLERLVEELQPERNASHHPLFRTMFLFEHSSKRVRQAAGLTLTPLDLHTGVAKFDLTLCISEREGALAALMEYGADLFEPGTITRLLHHYQALLQAVVGNPQARLSELRFLSEQESRHLLRGLNDTHTDYPRDQCVHRLFEEQAAKTPQATAVVFQDQFLTYRELDRAATRLALRLQQRGVGPETVVGLFVERSLEMLVGVLGVLKAGGAYLPMDLRYPAERLAFMLSDARPAVLLTQRKWLTALPPHHAHVVCLEEDATPQFDSPAGPGRKSRPRPENLAYVLYTSGSTGRPKGVEVSHRAVVNFLGSMRHCPGLEADDVLLAVTPLTFDIAALELFLPLSVGARVVIAGEEAAADGSWLAAVITENGVTAMQATPATWRLLVQSGWLGNSRLKILCGGEALPRPLANELLRHSHAVWNLYGPTETTVWSTLGRVEAGQDPVSIGRPLANTQIYLLDRYGQPVPFGLRGEVCIGGDGVARGYHNRADLTAAKFVPNPFVREGGSRLYRTGDLARYRADGRIEFLGRIDHQVKIRGHRIELGEIESVLGQHPAVNECVVTAREDSAGGQRLVAYAGVRPGHTPTGHELHEFIKGKLPPHMVPTAFVLLERLPRTPNGKADRAALRAPEEVDRVRARRFAEPCTEVEKKVAGVWMEVLGLERVGVHDHFFELGGHSLLATQVVSRLAQEFHIGLPVRALFEAPTVAELSAAVTQRQSALSHDEAQIQKRSERASAGQWLARLNRLSDAEVEELLAQELTR